MEAYNNDDNVIDGDWIVVMMEVPLGNVLQKLTSCLKISCVLRPPIFKHNRKYWHKGDGCGGIAT